MILIAHRGNYKGANPERENSPEYVIEAIEAGFNVEIDVWAIAQYGIFLGHDAPQYKINLDFFRANRRNYRIWAHAKNDEALEMLMREGIHCFWHNIDDYTLTSEGYVWTYPGKKLLPRRSIAVMPTQPIKDLVGTCQGVCGDVLS
jgi:hypothetical protein